MALTKFYGLFRVLIILPLSKVSERVSKVTKKIEQINREQTKGIPQECVPA